MEREVEDFRNAQRIADHALEIKAKMEAQLIEWGAMLQGLGVEPASKRHASTSPGGRKIIKPRQSLGRSPKATCRPRDSKGAEAAAMQEGRLPPIHENKAYPRRTMKYVTGLTSSCVSIHQANLQYSHGEILAIRSEAADTNDSPDLGPPPTSRFVEDDPVKIDSPTRSTGTFEPSPKIQDEVLPPMAAPPAQPVLDPKKKAVSTTSETTSNEESKSTKSTDLPSRPLMKAGSKRKFGDENDESQLSRAFAKKEAGKTRPEKPLATRDLKNRRSIKDLSSSKQIEKKPQITEVTIMRPRKPLAEKSANDDLVSPKKMVPSTTTGNLKETVTESDKANAPLKKKKVVPIKLTVPLLEPPSVIKPPQEPETPSADPGHVFPDTPEPKSAKENPAKDTPPPADISVHGETSRPSRRVRASISYAEPNLRDKMRRPTKELFDAVSGEGKFIRSSSAHPSGSVSLSKSNIDGYESELGLPKQPTDVEGAIEDEVARGLNAASPLLQREPTKGQPRADLLDSAVTERRRGPSSRSSQPFEQPEIDESVKEKKKQEADPYEFQSTSPTTEQSKETASKGRNTKGMRRSIAVTSGGSGDAAETGRPSRKRASMAAPKKAAMLDLSLDPDSSYEASGETANDEPCASTNDRVSRRRSMML